VSIEREITDWLHGRPDWQQEAAVRILANPVFGSSDLDQLTALCKTADGQKKTPIRIFTGLSGSAVQCQPLHIVSIGEIHGIENLRPRKPLTFGDGNLVVVYGNNGSGKSGYVRILKKICGKANTGALRTNVFATAPDKRCCKIEFKINGSPIPKEWDVDAVGGGHVRRGQRATLPQQGKRGLLHTPYSRLVRRSRPRVSGGQGSPADGKRCPAQQTADHAFGVYEHDCFQVV
jgi:hypothetical protein